MNKITKDKLLKLGFEKEYENRYSIGILPNLEIEIIFYKEGLKVWIGLQPLIHIKSIEQINNLIFTLTGK